MDLGERQTCWCLPLCPRRACRVTVTRQSTSQPCSASAMVVTAVAQWLLGSGWSRVGQSIGFDCKMPSASHEWRNTKGQEDFHLSLSLSLCSSTSPLSPSHPPLSPPLPSSLCALHSHRHLNICTSSGPTHPVLVYRLSTCCAGLYSQQTARFPPSALTWTAPLLSSLGLQPSLLPVCLSFLVSRHGSRCVG